MWWLLLSCTSSSPGPAGPPDSVVPSEDTAPPSAPDDDLPDGTCLVDEMVSALGYLEPLSTLERIDASAHTMCLQSWRCGTRRGFGFDVSECSAMAFYDDVVGLFATQKYDDGGGDCFDQWTGEVVLDCPLPTEPMWSAGCVLVDPSVFGDAQPLPPAPSTLEARLADGCFGTADCTVDGELYTVVALPVGDRPTVEVYDAEGQRAGLAEWGVWHGDPRLRDCLALERQASEGCGLIP